MDDGIDWLESREDSIIRTYVRREYNTIVLCTLCLLAYVPTYPTYFSFFNNEHDPFPLIKRARWSKTTTRQKAFFFCYALSEREKDTRGRCVGYRKSAKHALCARYSFVITWIWVQYNIVRVATINCKRRRIRELTLWCSTCVPLYLWKSFPLSTWRWKVKRASCNARWKRSWDLLRTMVEN